MHARCVDEHNLAFRFRDDSLDAKASGLWFIRDGSDLLPNQSIQQSRFASIWPPNKSDIARVLCALYFVLCTLYFVLVLHDAMLISKLIKRSEERRVGNAGRAW